MSNQFAIESVLSLWLMFGMFGLIMFGANSSSTLQAERIKTANRARRTKKKKTAVRKKQGRGHGHSTLMGGSTLKGVKKQGRSTKTAKTRPLSQFNQAILDRYFIGRDFPNFKHSSNIPL